MTHDLLTLISIVMILALVGLLLKSLRSLPNEREAEENFRQRYGTVEALMVLGELDLMRLKEQREQGRLQRWDAIRDVMAQANVPEWVATELVDRL